MAAWLAFSAPAGVLALLALATYELHPKRRKRKGGTPLSATTIDEVTAFFYGSKRTELEHRDSTSVLRLEDAEGAPPKMGVDLDRGTVTMRGEPGPAPKG